MDDEDEISYRGKFLDLAADPPCHAAWRFYPKRKKQRITEADLAAEIFDEMGCGGMFYGILLHIPDENFVAEDYKPYVDVYEPEDLCKILAGLCNYTLLDTQGREIQRER